MTRPSLALEAAVHELFDGLGSVSVWDGGSASQPFAEEARAVERGIESRREEFARGRATARRALGELGFDQVAIPVGPSREPIWPAGVVGSITHCEGFVAAVVASESDVVAVGVDAEPARALPDETRDLVLLASERDDRDWAELVVFSAKESIYKAVFPTCRVWIDFLDVELTLDERTASFSATSSHRHPAVRDLVEKVEGRYRRVGGLVVTGAMVRSG